MKTIEWPRFGLGWSGPMATGKLHAAVREKRQDPLRWVPVEAPALDLKFWTTTDGLSVDGRRLGVSYRETIEIAKLLGGDVIPATKKLVDAIYAAAPIKTAFHSLVTASDPDSGGTKMGSDEFASKYNADVDRQIVAKGGTPLESFAAGHDKYWLLHPRLAEKIKATGLPAAINYGGHEAGGKPQQSVGGRHDVEHMDYSQLFRPVKRYAMRLSDGSKVDLLAWAETEEGVPSRFTEPFKTR